MTDYTLHDRPTRPMPEMRQRSNAGRGRRPVARGTTPPPLIGTPKETLQVLDSVATTRHERVLLGASLDPEPSGHTTRAEGYASSLERISPVPVRQQARTTPAPQPLRERPRRRPTFGELDDSAKIPAPITPTPIPAVLSSHEALREHEVARTRRLIPLIAAIAALAFVVLPFLGGSPAAKLALQAALLVTILASAWLHVLLRESSRLTELRLGALSYLQMSSIFAADLYFGVASGASIVMVLAVYYLGVSHRRKLATTAFVVLVTYHGALGVAIATGLIADPGLITANHITTGEKLAGLALVESVMLVAFLLARISHQETLASFERLERAAQGIAQRDALVMEARQDLHRAMRIDGLGGLTGQVVGSFELDVLIGRGGMGEVYKARNLRTGELAAVKVLQSSQSHNARTAARFLREVHLVASLNVPNVVRVVEVGAEAHPVPYLAMEYLEGKNLAHHLRTRRRLTPEQTARMVRQIGQGIHSAGMAGIIHRDLKPQNLFLAKKPDGGSIWKILDFGVSTLSSSRGTLTQGRVVGTPAYMAPEQARGRAVDHRADLYALTAIAYRAITGYAPFSGEDIPVILHQVVYEMPRRPSALLDLPRDVDAVLAIGMAKDPDSRFASAQELSDALSAAITGELPLSLRMHAEEVMAVHPWR